MLRVERHLDWPDCLNVRDTGGLPTTDGVLTRWGALLRADDLCRLTPDGQGRLAASGVRTVIDLRGPSESIGSARGCGTPPLQDAGPPAGDGQPDGQRRIHHQLD